MSRRTDVLAGLREAGEAGVSGEALALRLGISRAAIAKHVAALESLGYRITAVPGKGYRLDAVPDLPLPEEVAPLLSSSMWVRLKGGGDTGSTNDDAKRMAREGAAEGCVVLATRQTAGRGRLGRAWSSPEGGVYLSVVLRPDLGVSELVALPLAVSVAVARAAEGLGASGVGLKWPNDVWLGSRKLAGVLLETAAEADRVNWVVVGVGVNVRRPNDTEAHAAYLEDCSPSVRLPQVAASLLDEIAEVYVAYNDDGFESVRSEYERRAVLTGSEVGISGPDGLAKASGKVLGVDGEGRLLLETTKGTTALSAGDVTLR